MPKARDRKKPVIGAKRYGHKSHVRHDRMIRVLEKGGYFEEKIEKEKRKYEE